ncbi:MAG: hypothetical protein ABEI77_01540 [Halorientalis sp.]
MPSDDSDREEGVSFDGIDSLVAEIEFPTTKDDFVAEFGQQTIERTNAEPIRIDDLFEGTGSDTFESPTELRQSILNLMPGDSVGRQRYSDRGGSIPNQVPDADEFQNDESI